MKKLLATLAFLSMFTSTTSQAGGYSNWAKPTDVHVIQDKGFRVVGNYGQPNSCEISNQIFVQSNHPQYDEIYSMALAALMGQKEIRFYVSSCIVVSWISSKTIGSFGTGQSQIDIRY